MTHYTNYILLKGLDEARAHQRGEPVGKPTVTKPPKVRTKPPGRKPMFTIEKQREIATRKGSVESVAKEYGCRPHNIYHIRAQYKKGLL